MRMSLVCMHVCACARAMCIYVYEWIHEFIYGRREQPDPSLHLLATIHLLVYPSTNHILQIHDFIWTDRSQSALNIRPAPGKSWFTVGPYEWWEYKYNFLEHNVPSLTCFSLNFNTKACEIEALKTCIMFCLRLVRAVLPANSPIAAHQTTGFMNRTVPNWKGEDKSVPTKVLVFWNEKTKFPQGFSGPLWSTLIKNNLIHLSIHLLLSIYLSIHLLITYFRSVNSSTVE